jgi:hypothetical protein
VDDSENGTISRRRRVETRGLIMKKKNKVKLNDETLEEIMSSDFPKIYIYSIEDQPDGDYTMTFDTNKAFDESYKKAKGRKRVSQKGIGNYILELFQKGLDKEDGYELKTLNNLDKLPSEGGTGGHY